MGWWKIADVETGQISQEMPSGHPGEECSLVNAIPGRDAAEDYYNGDGPADIMSRAIKDIIEQYKEAWGRPPYLEELEAANFTMNPRRKSDKE